MIKLRRLDAKINFVINVTAFVIIIAAIFTVILPYLSRLESTTNLDESATAEPNIELKRND